MHICVWVFFTLLKFIFQIFSSTFLYHNFYFHNPFHIFPNRKRAFRFLGKPHKIQFLQIYQRLLDDSSNTTVNITTCIVLNIFSDILFYIMVHFVIIISISKVFQVQNKPMGFLPPIQMKGLITMKLIHARYNLSLIHI